MSFFGDLFGAKKGQTTTQQAMTTPEQDQARQMLAQFMQTGQFGPYNAGQPSPVATGDYKMSDAEQLGQGKLMDLINSALPQSFTNGKNELQSVLDGKYDPNDPNGVYKGFKTETLANQSDAQDALNRQLSVTGDTYSTNRARSTAQLNTNTTNALNSKLAELYQNYSGQRLGAATGLMDAGIQEEGLNQGRINLANTVGSLPRLLADAQAKAQYADWIRQHGELSSTVDAAKALFSKDVPYGVKSVTGPDQPSTFMSMLGEVSPIVGSYNTAQYGYTTNQSSIGSAVQAALKAMGYGG